MKKTVYGIVVAGVASFAASYAQATTFAAWEVADVSFGDTLNVRKYPSPGSQKQAAYPNGTVLQMTGKCTGGVNLLDIAGQSDASQRRAVRRVWCQVWHDPSRDNEFQAGWVYGKFIRPR